MKKFLTLLLIAVLSITSTPFADDEETELPVNISNNSYYAGFRLGTWISSGDTPPPLLYSADSSEQILTDISDANFYAEGYFGYRLTSKLYTEISFGMSNRGTVEVRNFDYNTYDLNNLIVYPILLQLKVYPFGTATSKIQPFIAGGGGIYYGRNTVQLTNDYFYTYRIEQGESATDFNYTIAGGFDYLMSSTLSLELHARYAPIKFPDGLLTVEDYSATTITVGLKYRYNSKK
ncbi:MAG: hypothetical protein DWP97_11900 [Calditrichaeota bacterium]|nr:MAG: hypothetical protein DWP97_11900 [Calditrichota bacterium]